MTGAAEAIFIANQVIDGNAFNASAKGDRDSLDPGQGVAKSAAHQILVGHRTDLLVRVAPGVARSGGGAIHIAGIGQVKSLGVGVHTSPDRLIAIEFKRDAPSAVTRLDRLIDIADHRPVDRGEGVGGGVVAGRCLDADCDLKVAAGKRDRIQDPGAEGQAGISQTSGLAAVTIGAGVCSYQEVRLCRTKGRARETE